jgi:hypothetical protein
VQTFYEAVKTKTYYLKKGGTNDETTHDDSRKPVCGIDDMLDTDTGVGRNSSGNPEIQLRRPDI